MKSKLVHAAMIVLAAAVPVAVDQFAGMLPASSAAAAAVVILRLLDKEYVEPWLAKETK